MHGSVIAARRCLSAIGLALVAFGCGKSAESSGNSSIVPIATSRFVLDTVPTFSMVDGDNAGYQFVRARARKLSDGAIVVAEQGGPSIRIYSRDGNLQTTLATRGKGPGELSGEFTFRARGDTMMAIGQPPLSTGDIRIYAKTGFVRSLRPAVRSNPMLHALESVSSNVWLVEHGAGYRSIGDSADASTLRADSIQVGLFLESFEGSSDSMIELPRSVREWYYWYHWVGGPIEYAMAPYPFAARTMHAVVNGELWEIDGGIGRIIRRTPGGATIEHVQLAIRAAPFNDRVWNSRLARELSQAGSNRDSVKIRSLFSTSTRPTLQPLFSRAMGTSSELWLEYFELDERRPRLFLVLDRQGQPIGDVQVPRRLELNDAGLDFVIGVDHVDNGVERIVELGLRRSTPR